MVVPAVFSVLVRFGVFNFRLAEAEVLPAGAGHDEDHGEGDEHELVSPLVRWDQPEVVFRTLLHLLLYLLFELFPILACNLFQILLIILHHQTHTFSIPSKYLSN